MSMLEWMLAAGAVLAAVALVMTLLNLRLYRRPQPGDTALAGGPLVSVCVPARNEEANLGACVGTLLAGTYRDIEVLVYNDQSIDRTGEVLAQLCAQDARVRAVPTAALPPGWNGKQFGCDTMGRAARGEWVLFTDADVRFTPGAVGAAVSVARRMNVALLSTFPRQVTGTLAERLVVPMIFFILMSYLPFARMRRTLDPAASAACGQFILCRREAYLKCGGHGALRESMHDGVKLPRAMRRAGERTDLFDGTGLCHVRMYVGLGQVWRGFAKNAFEGLGSVGLLVFVTVVHALAQVLPWVMLGVWGAMLALGQVQWTDVRLGVALAGAGVLVAVVQRCLLAARFGQHPVGVLLHPVGVALMTAIQWWSLWLHLTGRRVWRGRGTGIGAGAGAGEGAGRAGAEPAGSGGA
jgi:cellulose synthase/poly-beta-1,6-N-acetylglucosamine synthase-like glycosyltransferase